MKIAIASSGLGHVARGIEAWAEDLAAALHAAGEHVTLSKGGGAVTRPYERFVPCWQRDAAKTTRLLRRLPRRLSWRLGLGSPYAVEQTTFAWNLIRRLRREPADVLHVQDPLVAIILQRARRWRLIRTRTILAHGTEEPPAFLNRIDYLQHLAPWHLEQAKLAGAWKPAWTAIPNFIDTATFSPGRSDALRTELGIPADAVVVLTAAAIKRHHKRIDHLIAEFARVLGRGETRGRQKPIYLVIAGGWETETDALIEEATKLLGNRVRFLVRFPRARMPELYRAADIFVLASLFEMMPIALIEACASGLPCVTHSHPVPHWMTGPGGVGIDMANPGVLAMTLAELANDAGRRRTLGDAARAHCVANFGTTAVVGRIREYYRTVMST